MQIQGTEFQLTSLKCEKWLYYHNAPFFKTQDWPAVVALLKALGIQKMTWLDSVKVLVYTALGHIWPHPDADQNDPWAYTIHIWFPLQLLVPVPIERRKSRGVVAYVSRAPHRVQHRAMRTTRVVAFGSLFVAQICDSRLKRNSNHKLERKGRLI